MLSRAKGRGKNFSGCFICRLRKKKCEGGPYDAAQHCDNCEALNIACLGGYGERIPKGLKAQHLEKRLAEFTRRRANRAGDKLVLFPFCQFTPIESVASCQGSGSAPTLATRHPDEPPPMNTPDSFPIPSPIPSTISAGSNLSRIPGTLQSPLYNSPGFETRAPPTLTPSPFHNFEFFPMFAPNMDGVNLNASEQNVHHSNGADLVASLFAGVTQQSQHEAGMHRLHFPSPPEFIGIPLQENSFVVNGLLDGGIPHYPDPGAAAGGHQYTHAPHPEEPIRWDYFGSNCEPAIPAVPEIAVFDYDDGLQQNESLAYPVNRVSAAGPPGSPAPYDAIPIQDSEASAREWARVRVPGPSRTPMVGLSRNTPWAGEPNYSAGPSLTASRDSQRHQASPRNYVTLDAPPPLHSRTTGLFGPTTDVPHFVMHSQNPPPNAGGPEACPGYDEVLFLDHWLHTP